jgi:arylsulfatase A-like enzyme
MHLRTAIVAFLAAATVGAADPGRGARPDVLLVIWDTTRPDRLTPYGAPRDTTPHLARIAASGVVFEQAYSTAPWTIPAVAGIFTGLFSHNHRVDLEPKGFALDLPAGVPTLAEMLKAAGYTTALFTAQDIFYKPGFRRGFDRHALVNQADLVSLALGFLDRAGDTPAFLTVYWRDPHAPWEPEPAHDLWRDRTLPPVNIASRRDDRAGYLFKQDVNTGAVTLTPPQWTQLQALYDGELHQNDAALGALWTGLERRGIADTTLFVFTADHGEGFGEHPRQRVWHDYPYDTILHVPLVVRLPSRVPARRVRTTVRTIDVCPTVLDVVGAEPPDPLNGESLLPLARTGSGQDRSNVGTTHFADGAAFFRGEGYKLIYTRTGEERAELFDLAADPGERTDLASRRELLEAVKGKRQRFVERTTLPMNVADTPAPSAEVERLRELGYVE